MIKFKCMGKLMDWIKNRWILERWGKKGKINIKIIKITKKERFKL